MSAAISTPGAGTAPPAAETKAAFVAFLLHSFLIFSKSSKVVGKIYSSSL